jgi:hypothetical protein
MRSRDFPTSTEKDEQRIDRSDDLSVFFGRQPIDVDEKWRMGFFIAVMVTVDLFLLLRGGKWVLPAMISGPFIIGILWALLRRRRLPDRIELQVDGVLIVFATGQLFARYDDIYMQLTKKSLELSVKKCDVSKPKENIAVIPHYCPAFDDLCRELGARIQAKQGSRCE